MLYSPVKALAERHAWMQELGLLWWYERLDRNGNRITIGNDWDKNVVVA